MPQMAQMAQMTQMALTARIQVLAAVMVLGLAPVAVAQTRPVTVDDVMELKGVGAPAVSPDGTRVLYTVRGWEAPSGAPPDHVRAAGRLAAAVVA